jgi:hypothetical protein
LILVGIRVRDPGSGGRRSAFGARQRASLGVEARSKARAHFRIPVFRIPHSEFRIHSSFNIHHSTLLWIARQ